MFCAHDALRYTYADAPYTALHSVGLTELSGVPMGGASGGPQYSSVASRTTKGSDITTPAGCSPVAAMLQNTLTAVSTRATTSICAVRAVVTPTAARFARAVHLGAGRSRPIWARPGRPQPNYGSPLQVEPHGWQAPDHLYSNTEQQQRRRRRTRRQQRSVCLSVTLAKNP